jgi:AAA+ ATPase superfamily predicted ATPase
MGHPCFVIGNVARGEDFWNREAEIEAIWKALSKSHVLLKAPRRFGKTSVMFQVLEQPRDGCKVFFHDTEGMRDPEEFVSIVFAGLLADSTIRTFLRGASKKIDDLLSRIKIEVSSENMPDIRLGLKDALQSDWAEKGKALISHLRGYDGRLLIILDELPLLIQRIEKKKGAEVAADFCHWFRSVRQMPGLDHVRWLVAAPSV